MLRKIALGGLLSIFATFFVIEVPWSALGWLGVRSAQANSNPKSVDSAPARTRGAPGSDDVTGRWSGQIHDTQDGDGDFSMTITRRNHSFVLHGDWSSTLGKIGTGGNLLGELSKGNSLLLQLRGGNCQTIAFGTLADANHIIAVYRASECGERSSGYFDVTR